MQHEACPLLLHHSLHLSPSIHPAPGVMYLTHPIFSLNLFPRCFHFLSSSSSSCYLFPPSGTSQVKQPPPPPPHAHLFTPSPSPQRSLFRLSCGCKQHSFVPLVSLSCLLFYCPTHPAVHPQAYITTSGASATLSSLFVPAVIYSLSPSTLFLVSLHHFIIQLKPLLSAPAVILWFLRGPESPML